MAREVRLCELLAGVEGLALLRNLHDGSTEDADRRLAELRRILADDAFAAATTTTEGDVTTGYRLWSQHYDQPGNLLIALEQPEMWAILDTLKPGDALDAACGTGRHTRKLVDLGHQVTGIDLTPEMLAIAKNTVPEAQFHTADLLALPFAGPRFDTVVSGLAIAHLADLRAGIAELARVMRPGGRLIISAPHPFQAHLGWHATFQDADGNGGFVREYPHTHADYLAAFAAAGLTVVTCVEPPLGIADVPAKRRAYRHFPEATIAAYLGLPARVISKSVILA
ncbi:MAG TPA: class I SAM-dependent methyltransferase [Pseudonocardiaceae bacterium]|nr:class I SAM-dependent methyltransferase [Pseudonocardiaceae bacterium]